MNQTSNIVDTVFNAVFGCRVSVIWTVTGTAIITLALAACSQGTPSITSAAQGGGTSNVQGGGTSNVQGSTFAARSSASAAIRPASGGAASAACPTQGIGGDSLPPLCAPLSPSHKHATISMPGTAGTTSAGLPSAPPSAAPRVTGVSPNQGSDAGGDSVIIDGTGFCADPQVSFGGVAAQATDESDTEIAAKAPPDQAGHPTVDITVSCDGSISPAVAADKFTYLPTTTSATPTAPSVSP